MRGREANTGPAERSSGLTAEGLTSSDPSQPLRQPRAAAGIKGALRRRLLPQIQRETRVIAWIQQYVQHPTLVWLFAAVGIFGTHMAFLTGLPVFFWFPSGISWHAGGGHPPSDIARVFGRGLIYILATGVYCTGFIKDWMCLPRPAAPVRPITLDKAISLEYGFPSTHTANAVSIALHVIIFYHQFAHLWDGTSHLAVTLLAAGYAATISLSRIISGMHSFTDVLGGLVLGVAVVLIYWGCLFTPFERYIHSVAAWIPPLLVGYAIIAVSVHTDPEGPCPCFDDSVAFIGACTGAYLGSWHYGMYLRDVANHTFPVMDPVSRSGSVRYLFWALRFVWGVGLLFGWRLMAKHICYTLLPPLYRVLARALPFRRKFFHLARDYGGIPAEHITFFPSVLYLNAHTASDPHTYKLPRYDVDIATKLIVYTGIGWLATMVIPLVNERLNL